MARMKENPRYNVISMRISENELKHLENLMETTHKSISGIMREAIDFYAASHEHSTPCRSAEVEYAPPSKFRKA